MTTGQLWQEAWEWHWSVAVGSAMLGAGYPALVRPLRPLRTAAFVVGAVLIAVTILGPLDYLGDQYLFSAHMLEHMVFWLVIPPLLLLGLPPETARRLLAWPRAAAVERVLSRPAVAWLVFVITLYAWHLPLLFNAALASEPLHAFQHLSFLVTATIFWWPVLSPLPDHRLPGHVAILYLFLASFANAVLGVVLTFTGPGLYPLYARPTDDSAVLQLLRGKWGLTPAVDQQLGGLFMWVGGSLFFLAGILGMVRRWLRESGRPGTP